MPRRWHTKTRQWIYRYLVERDGDLCQECGKIPRGIFELDIDHIDSNPRNDDPSNLRLLCHRCNVAIENKSRVRSKCPREREPFIDNQQTRIVKQAVSYSEASHEMRANFLFEVDYREWIITFIKDHGWITKSDAVNAGAEVVGCNPTTAAKYLAKLTSIVGPLIVSKDMLGEVVVSFKSEVYRNGHNRKNGQNRQSITEVTDEIATSRNRD